MKSSRATAIPTAAAAQIVAAVVLRALCFPRAGRGAKKADAGDDLRGHAALSPPKSFEASVKRHEPTATRAIVRMPQGSRMPLEISPPSKPMGPALPRIASSSVVVRPLLKLSALRPQGRRAQHPRYHRFLASGGTLVGRYNGRSPSPG